MIVKFNPEKTGIGKFISIFGTKLPKVTEEVKTLFNTISTLPMTDRGSIINNPIVQNDENLKKYISTVDSAQWSLENFNQWMVENGRAISTFSVILNKAKGILKGFATGLINMAIGLAVGKLIEVGLQAWDNYVHKAEKLKEAAQNAADTLDDEKQKLEDTKSNLKEINDKIDALLMKDSLTFVEEQDLQNLREQKALLEDELRLTKKIAAQNKEDFLDKQKTAYDEEKKKYDDHSLVDVNGEVRAVDVINAIQSNDQAVLASNSTEIKAKLKEMLELGTAEADDIDEANEKIKKALDARKKFYSDYLTSMAEKGGIGDEQYESIKDDYIEFLKDIGDSATLAIYMDATEGFDKAYKAAAQKIKSGEIKTAADLKEAIGADLYNIFEEACKSVGIKVDDMISNIYADLTDNLDSDYLAKKMRQANNNLAGKTVQIGDTNAYREYLQEIEDFTNTLSDEQKQIYLDVVDSANTLAEAKRLYNESAYKNDRQGYVDSHKTALSTFAEEGRRVTQVNAAKEAANAEFSDFINKLSETDYQIAIKLDVDASQTIEDIQKQIRDSKTEKTLKDVLSETFANADGEDAKLEDIVSTVTGNIDKIKAKIVELNKNGITALSPAELIEFERLAPGITTELDKWDDDTLRQSYRLLRLLWHLKPKQI